MCKGEFDRGLTMGHTAPSTPLLLPFGSLMGSIPVDAVPRGQVPGGPVGVLDRVTAGVDSRAMLFAGSHPASAAWPPSLSMEDGGI
jgi:hypothetical protein